jgi:hypothetical protein
MVVLRKLVETYSFFSAMATTTTTTPTVATTAATAATPTVATTAATAATPTVATTAATAATTTSTTATSSATAASAMVTSKSECKSGKTKVANVYHPNSGVTVNVMRPSMWGNPFPIVKSGPLKFRATRAEVIAKYREWIKTKPKLLARLPELKGQVLGCCCAPLPCHADVLAQLADQS